MVFIVWKYNLENFLFYEYNFAEPGLLSSIAMYG